VVLAAGLITISRGGPDQLATPLCAHAHAVHRDAGPVQQVVLGEPVEQARCNRSHTPACCRWRSRRQQVTPDPQPNSWGRSFQLIPVRAR
jgi:hypothetical protein